MTIVFIEMLYEFPIFLIDEREYLTIRVYLNRSIIIFLKYVIGLCKKLLSDGFYFYFTFLPCKFQR